MPEKCFSTGSYERVWSELDAVIKRLNPCKVVHHKNGKVSCTGSRSRYYMWFEPDDQFLCCNGCKYITLKGCTIKSIGCKIWLCPIAIEHLMKRISGEEAKELCEVLLRSIGKVLSQHMPLNIRTDNLNE